MNRYLNSSKLLDYQEDAIQGLIRKKNWSALPNIERIKAIYNFVRDDIYFGYNRSDELPASQILRDGYGQCNTKATLLMALLRATGIPNRIHGFTIDKALQKGAITGISYWLSPKNILHSWVEVYYNDQWYFLEGVILDKKYLTALQKKNPDCKTTFCGYGAYTDNFQNPPIEWNINNTFIQEKGINQDFGVFDSPDDLYSAHRQNLNAIQRFVFQKIIRHKMNRNVRAIRDNK